MCALEDKKKNDNQFFEELALTRVFNDNWKKKFLYNILS